MGTEQKVYRYKGLYFVYYNDYSYDSDFMLSVFNEIPYDVSEDDFERWVRSLGNALDEEYERLIDLDDNDWKSDYVTDEQPGNGLVIEWIFEIDLDNRIFHVDSEPLFRLDNMPPTDIFLKAISFDHFGHRAYNSDTPMEFRYDWRSPPPTPSTASIDAYNSFCDPSYRSSIDELLRIPAALSSIERTHTKFMELLVTGCMGASGVGHHVRLLENVPHRNQIPPYMLKLALSLVTFAVGPPLPSLPCRPCTTSGWDYIWIRKDVCLRITTHLDDEANLQAAVSDLVQHINATKEKSGVVYGVACSIFHCAVVRVDKGMRGTSSAHTSALQFLPSFYATKISTPGIDALSRLGCQASGTEFLADISESLNLPPVTHSESLFASSVAAKLPVELWMRIGTFITAPIGLLSLSCISPQAMSVAADLAHYPLVMDFRLVDVIDCPPPIVWNRKEYSHEDYKDYFERLGCAKFTAVKNGRRVNVELGQEISGWASDRRPMVFGIQTYLSGSNLMNRIYVEEQEEDEVY
jgi:hypothetical protein